MTALFGKSLPYLIAAALLLIAALLFWGGIQTVDGWISNARKQAIEERDAVWTTKLAEAEVAAQKKITENLKQAMAAQQKARDDIEAANKRGDELEKLNAELAEKLGGGGISRERGELLNRR